MRCKTSQKEDESELLAKGKPWKDADQFVIDSSHETVNSLLLCSLTSKVHFKMLTLRRLANNQKAMKQLTKVLWQRPHRHPLAVEDENLTTQ